MTDNDAQISSDPAPTNHRMYATLFGIAAVFLLSLLGGYIFGMMEAGNVSVTGGLTLAVLTLLTAYTGKSAWSHWRKAASEPEAPSARKSRNIYIFSMAVGAALGVYMILTGGPDVNVMFSNDPISNVTAIGAILIWAVATPIITVLWWRTADEHEIAAYSAGSLIAFHLYVFIVPSWWMATRAGWLPSQEPMILWAFIMIIWSAAWLYRKFF